MKFVHYSAKKLGAFRFEPELGVDMKPHHVLWVARDEEWKNFLEEIESDMLKTYKYKYTFDIDMKKVIEVGTHKQARRFEDEFAVNEYDIDWNKVRRETGMCGIYVKNTLNHKLRMDFKWFSSFDVESIGIWDNSCIKSGTEQKL